ncbi:DeoR/GlpR family DNA-binding transcription regulator [Vibrio sp. YMD68]|uniref:DeoR/GlpR family DNA-binding transcription regulator n=1 Tax=Vibrio sp. YMD68 TaxID=3042300 RepID=UPI00249CE53D|nr:DeoR/GlpR family DNA-binding transcription regulator [Vibrio sp. YMD68]WGV98916.1 DeoR/GlpR family DNA-binding transcription regulator [Vibrio sp. YMD68]
MKAAARANHILRIISEFGQASVADLTEELDVSPETIRRDLKRLDRSKDLIRVHGGAVKKKSEDIGTSFNKRAGHNVCEKKSLVDQVIPYLYEGAVIGLDASSSSWLVAQFLPDIECTVITNSLNNITALANNTKVTIISLGGVFSEKYKAFYGRIPQKILSELSLDICVISCEGFDEISGVWDSNEYNYEIKKSLLSSSRQSILIADKNKYKKKSLVKICNLNEVDILITNKD